MFKPAAKHQQIKRIPNAFQEEITVIFFALRLYLADATLLTLPKTRATASIYGRTCRRRRPHHHHRRLASLQRPASLSEAACKHGRRGVRRRGAEQGGAHPGAVRVAGRGACAVRRRRRRRRGGDGDPGGGPRRVPARRRAPRRRGGGVRAARVLPGGGARRGRRADRRRLPLLRRLLRAAARREAPRAPPPRGEPRLRQQLHRPVRLQATVEGDALLPLLRRAGQPPRRRRLLRRRPRRGLPPHGEVYQEYCDEMTRLALDVTEVLAAALGLGRGELRGFFAAGDSIMRLNHYPPCRQPELTLGTGPHRDPTSLTLLHQDDVGGLQVRAGCGVGGAAEWRDVRPRADAFVVNIGDTFAALTGGRHASCLHRAVVSAGAARTSLAFFLNPGLDTVVRPPDALLDGAAAAPRPYPDFTWREFLEFTQKHYRSDAATMDAFVSWIEGGRGEGGHGGQEEK